MNWPSVPVDARAWSAMADRLQSGEVSLLGLWGEPGLAHMAILEAGRPSLLHLRCSDNRFPSVGRVHPPAIRLERAMRDLYGLEAEGAPDTRPWLRHGAPYAFLPAEGEGLHQIPVGPVHAGIIEPGHFRFTANGETVVRLEQRLGYVHKGIASLMAGAPLERAATLAARVSGDSTVAHALAFARAVEDALGIEVPPRAAWLRALMLERERVASHLNDLGFLGNDAALGFGLAQFSRLREDWQRLAADAFGHRLMMDVVVPGGTAVDATRATADRLRLQCDAVERELRTLRVAYDEHAGLQDRFLGAGCVAPALAAQLGLTGMAGRASAQAFDLRCDHAWAPYDAFAVAMATQRNGDVAARVALRFDETVEALRLIRALCAGLPPGAVRAGLVPAPEAARGVGWVEGWRGEILVALETGADGRTVRCHCHDPSWQNWPVLEHAVIGNIVPDFPLINKSFNLSYSGHDL